jgi:hypothetical protein
MIIVIDRNQANLLINLTVIIIGKIIEISTSKIKKIIVIIKNCKEKGNRDDVLGSNPHSNGEYFSRSFFFFLEIIIEIKIKIQEINIMSIAIIIKKEIIYIIFVNKLFNWKLNILFIICKF